MIDSYNAEGFGKHVVKFTFQQDKYKLVIEESMGGNCSGFSVIEGTLDTVLDNMFDEADWCEITMTADDGDECDFEFTEKELTDTLVAVEILSWTREGE